MGDEEDVMAEDEESGAPSEEPSGDSSTSKIIRILLYVAGGILVLVLVVGISYLVSKNVQERSYRKSQDIVSAPPPPPLSSYELPEFSKATTDAEPHFVKMKIALAYKHDQKLNTELVQRRDQIQHIINIILQGKSYEELNSVTDAVALAEEIKAHVNVILISGKIKEVYFKEFVVN